LDRIRDRLSTAVNAYRTVLELHNCTNPFEEITPENFIIDSDEDTAQVDEDEVERNDNNKRNRRLARQFKEKAQKKPRTASDGDQNTGSKTDTAQDEA
jgi:hypothetical protein